MLNSPDRSKNWLLDALPHAAWQRWLPYLEAVDLPLGKVLCEPGSRPDYVYFPTTAIVSLLCLLEDGASSEIAVVGNEGLVGIASLMGGESTTSRAVVQVGGQGYRMRTRAMKAEFDRTGEVRHLLLRYTQALFTQLAQTVVCSRHHSLDQQLCRWLLLSLDRLPGSELLMTQELIAHMLGVRREGVTEAAHNLQQAGLIHYVRGHISVLDRKGLETRVCECYETVKKEYDRLLPKKTEAKPCVFTFPVMPAVAGNAGGQSHVPSPLDGWRGGQKVTYPHEGRRAKVEGGRAFPRKKGPKQRTSTNKAAS